MKLIHIGALAALLLVAASLMGVLRPGAARSADPVAPATTTATTTAGTTAGTISVSGNGTVTTVPDRGTFTFGVTSPATTARAAFQANAAAMRQVIGAVKGAGVASADIQTTQVSLDVRLSQEGDRVVGYVASSSVTAVLKGLATAGSVVDAAVAAGADSVSGPALSSGDTDTLYRQALGEAVSDARLKAQALAAAAGLTLGKAVEITEGGGGPQPVPFAAGAKAADAGTPIEPGSQEIQASVQITFSTL
jgi:uncharacterized protein